MIDGWLAVYLRETIILRRRLTRLIPAWSVSPLLYLVAFGFAVGRNSVVHGHTYLEFLLPGLLAMTSMTQAFAIASEINVARFYHHIFEEFQAAPISNTGYVLGEVLAAITRALLAGTVIIILGLLFGVFMSFNIPFLLGYLLNAFIFASLAVALAMLVKSHADQTLLTSFIITPMGFLGGTFFPLESLPSWVQKVLAIAPLTHAARVIRAASFGESASPTDFAILAVLGCVTFVFAVSCVNKARD
jgi:Nod factor-specific ABC transporter NodJ protein